MAKKDVFLDNIQNKVRSFDIPAMSKNPDAIFNEAWRKDPRIIALIKDMDWSETETGTSLGSVVNYGLIRGMSTGRRLQFAISYNDFFIDDVSVVESVNISNFSIKTLIEGKIQKNGFPPETLIFVTDNFTALWESLSKESSMEYYGDVYHLMQNIGSEEIGFPTKKCKYRAMKVNFICQMSPEVYCDYEEKAKAKAEQIIRAIAIDAPQIPVNVKAFIAFAYIQLETDYDSTVAEKLSNGQNLNQRDVLSLTAYGALCNHIATSRGLADAFEWLLYFAGVSCEKVLGRLNEIDAEPEYYWNVLWLKNNSTAYCDCSYGIENARMNQKVNCTAFLKTVDDFMDLKYQIVIADSNPLTVNKSVAETTDYINKNIEKLYS